MAYLPLRNYKYDSGPHRLQSGPAHESYIVVTSGVDLTGADNGIIVDGTPLNGVTGSGQKWSYSTEWRYVPLSFLSVGETVNSVNYQTSGTLDSYSYTQISSPISAAGIKLTTSVESNTTFTNIKYKRSVYYNGGCPDNQNYSPFNTPESNTLAQGKTGGGVTHHLYESPLLINSLGGQGTSNRSEWTYNQPVYCDVYTESIRPTSPGLMSSVIRNTYRGKSTGYLLNYGDLLLSNPGSALEGITVIEEQLQNENYIQCTPDPPEAPVNTTPHPNPVEVYAGDILTTSFILTGLNNDIFCCTYSLNNVKWYNTNGEFLGSGGTYVVQNSDINFSIYYTVAYDNNLPGGEQPFVVLTSPSIGPVLSPVPVPPCGITDSTKTVINPGNKVVGWPVGTYDPCGLNQMRFTATGVKFNTFTCAAVSFSYDTGWGYPPISSGEIGWMKKPDAGEDFCSPTPPKQFTYDDTFVYIGSTIGTETTVGAFVRTQRGFENGVTWASYIRPVNPSGQYVRSFPQPGDSAYGQNLVTTTGVI